MQNCRFRQYVNAISQHFREAKRGFNASYIDTSELVFRVEIFPQRGVVPTVQWLTVASTPQRFRSVVQVRTVRLDSGENIRFRWLWVWGQLATLDSLRGGLRRWVLCCRLGASAQETGRTGPAEAALRPRDQPFRLAWSSASLALTASALSWRSSLRRSARSGSARASIWAAR